MNYNQEKRKKNERIGFLVFCSRLACAQIDMHSNHRRQLPRIWPKNCRPSVARICKKGDRSLLLEPGRAALGFACTTLVSVLHLHTCAISLNGPVPSYDSSRCGLSC
jgi:hypothetical protein